MCWLLVRAFSDQVASAWKLGDIVEVRPDTFTGWGKLETLPRYYRVRVTGVDDANLDRIKAKLEAADVVIDPGTGQVTAHIRDRLYGVRISEIPAAVKTQLQTTGTVTVTKTQVVNFIRDNANVPIDPTALA